MSNEVYEVLAMASRYLFTLLMLVIVFRAWKITIVDNRRARKLRQIAPETGLSGELIVLEGGEKAREGMRYPVIREGMIGSSRKADIRIRHRSVEPVHAYFELTEDGLKLRAHGDALMSESWDEPVGRLILRDGDVVEFGNVQLLLVLTDARGGTRIAAPEPDPDPEDAFFGFGRTGASRTASPAGSGYDRDSTDEYDDPDPDFPAPHGRTGRPANSPYAQPQRRAHNVSSKNRAQDRGGKLFSTQIFPDDTEDDDDLFEPVRRTPDRSDPSASGRQDRSRRSAANDPDDEELWL